MQPARPPAVDLDYSVEEFHAGAHRDSAFFHERIEDVVVGLASAPGASRVLDVACGLGKQAARIARSGVETWGLEPSDRMIGLGRYLYDGSGVIYVRGIAEALPFREGQFDRVVCQGALDHFADANAFMREAARVLRPGGRVVIALANYDSLSCRLGRRLARVKQALGRPLPPGRPYWEPPEDHNVRGTLDYVKSLDSGVLELERCFGISLLWLFSRWGPLLDWLPVRAARALWQALDAVAYRTPSLADMIVSVWRRPEDAPS
ncbi:MAG TPA: class I SAM-dependent methyltransferase [Dehalococcoidia bacterium]|jgi:SAM-dependent methyltransferase|nr:class I SAM-dependent methyltransferase [Dehalococcoidia bacterium]